nr:MAG TPA: hypothetical protein [Caudoviricetes sp.]
MSENTFMKLYREATLPQHGTLYSGVPEASEADLMESFMAYAEASANMERNGVLYAEATQDLMVAKGLSLVGAIMYGEAEGGFFKKIIAAIVRLYEKAKDFVIKLLGRFKANKNYRMDIQYIKDVLDKVSKLKTFNEDDKINFKDYAYGAISNLIMGTIGSTLGTNSTTRTKTLLEVNLTDKSGKTITIKTLTDDLEGITDIKAAAKDAGKGIEEKFRDVQSARHMRDDESLIRYMYDSAIKNGGVSDPDLNGAMFGDTSTQKPAEAIAKLWDSKADTVKKGGDIPKAIEKLKEAADNIKYDDIEDALDKGVSEYKEKIDDLKKLMARVENKAEGIYSDRSDEANNNQDAKDNASSLMKISTVYSTYMTRVSTAVVTAFNTGKIQLDRFIGYVKPLCTQLDKLKNVQTSTAKE